jgi:hypothetical protein
LKKKTNKKFTKDNEQKEGVIEINDRKGRRRDRDR